MAGTVALHGDRALFVSQTYGSIKGQWGIPWGVVEAEESPVAAALRETREEDGVIARVEGLLGL
jgi:8-oxo-dGTP diphosphatase